MRRGSPSPTRPDGTSGALGDGLIGVVERAAPDASALRTTSLVLDRLAIARPGRGFFFMPAQTEEGVARFIRDFFGRYPNRLRALEPGESASSSGFERPIHPWVTSEIEHCRRDLAAIDELLTTAGHPAVVLTIGRDEATTLLLGCGWSDPEPWGAWSEGAMAEITLPSHGFRRVELPGHPFTPHGSVRVGISLASGPADYYQCSGETQIGIDFPVGDDHRRVASIRLHTPESNSPLDVGASRDPRRLGFGLRQLVQWR